MRCGGCRRSSSSGTCPATPARGLAVDGIFGPKTDAAVRGFQKALHQDIPSVTVDGIVGPVTWRALVSGMLSF
jgi:peptidoglycan hydrolase-like protein with peptidoglycan-binding domain